MKTEGMGVREPNAFCPKAAICLDRSGSFAPWRCRFVRLSIADFHRTPDRLCLVDPLREMAWSFLAGIINGNLIRDAETLAHLLRPLARRRDCGPVDGYRHDSHIGSTRLFLFRGT
jgi:hypothetical protein